MNRCYLSQLNYECPYFAAGFLHNLCHCFDIAFAQFGVTPRTRNRLDEIVAVAECYLISNHVKNKESKKQPFQICLPVKLADGRMSMKKEKKFLPNLQHFQFRQDGWKTFFIKISWMWTCSQIFRKFSYWENVLLFWITLHEAFAHL